MSFWKLITRSLAHHRRLNMAVAFGVAAATAVLTGALLVGDSMRHSLRDLALDRLGRIEEVVITSHFFREQLAEELFAGDQKEALREHYDFAVATALFPQGTVEHALSTDSSLRAANVLVIGSRKEFWDLEVDRETALVLPGPKEAVLNQALADELKVKAGDEITLRLPNTEQQVNPDNPLAEKEGRVSSLPRLKVAAVIPVRGLGRFSLRPSQAEPRNLYVHLDTLRDALDVEGMANAIFVAGKGGKAAASEEASRLLASQLKPTLEDYGLLAKAVEQRFTPPGSSESQVAFRYTSISTVQMVFADDLASAARQAFKPYNAQPVSTYLANAMYKPSAADQPPDEDQIVPYSMITGLTSHPTLGPLLADGGQPLSLAKDEIALTDWAANRMKVKAGDTIRLAYFEPETTHGKTVESQRDFRVKAIVPITKPKRAFSRRKSALFATRPTLANDPNLTPEVPGVTDKESMSDWQMPFPLTWNVGSEDDEFWGFYRTTPKAYVSMETAQELWGSRFGTLTSFRIPHDDAVTLPAIKQSLEVEIRKQELTQGFNWISLRRQGLKAASGTTPFDGLFLALSFFIIFAALMLVSLLFRLGIEQRAAEIGTMLAVGLRRRKTAYALIVEGLLVAACGGVLGVAIGIGYAQLMLLGLNTWWVGAVVTKFLVFHWTLKSLLIGYFAGVFVSALTIAWSVRQTKHVSVRQLMAGQGRVETALSPARARWSRWFAYGLAVAAIGLAVMATQLGGEAQAGAFVGGGASLLIALLLLTWASFRDSRHDRGGSMPILSLPRLALSTARRNPGRSTTTIGLMAFACFLIVSMSSFQLAPTREGQGGFDLIAESSQPIYRDLNETAVRRDIWGKGADDLDGAQIFAFRVRAGDDASCNNLYQATQPRVLGVTPAFANYFDGEVATSFAFAKSAAQNDQQRANPWHVLWDAEDDKQDGAVPVILDKNTAMYGLKLLGGVGQRFKFTYDDGHEIVFRVAGLLANSTLQGSLLVAEDRFEGLFPDTAGYRYFMIQSPLESGEEMPSAAATLKVAEMLENGLSDQGFDTYPAEKLLVQLLAVQNTYLNTFQSLGALGLLLGTLGLATVQIRNVVERRRELAMMRAQGFALTRLSNLVLLENLVLLLGGLLTGIVAALIAVLPHMIVGGASVPFAALGVMIGIVLVVGVLAALLATAKTSKAPLLSALRGE